MTLATTLLNAAPQPTPAQVKAAFAFTLAVTETIRELGEVPEGTLYATLMGKIDMAGFETLVRTITNTGLVEKRGHLLRWVGPTLQGDTHMTTFTINTDNVLQAFAGKTPAAPLAGAEYTAIFHTEAQMQQKLAAFPIASLVELWNGLAGTQGFESLKPVKKFENRTKALARLWTAMQSLTPTPAVDSKPAKTKRAKAPKPAADPVAGKDSKKDTVLAMLGRPGGATNADIQEATGWQPHTVRGFLSTAPKKIGKRISTSTNDAGARVYHMVYNAQQ